MGQKINHRQKSGDRNPYKERARRAGRMPRHESKMQEGYPRMPKNAPTRHDSMMWDPDLEDEDEE